MLYIESPRQDPYFNLALEEYLFEHTPPSKACFMLWQNDSAIIIGKYQNTAEEVSQTYVEQHGIKVVRRLSGGGAVYHDRGNLNFTCIMDQIGKGCFDFQAFSLPVLSALRELGVDAKFNGRNDLTIEGKKFSGNSQYIRKGRVLHHGCIMLDTDISKVAEALKVKSAKFESKSVKSVRSRVTTINEHAPTPIAMGDFKERLLFWVGKNEPLEPFSLSSEELAEVEKLARHKYAAWEWNYGSSPHYNVRREMRFPSGLVTAQMSVDGSIIQHIRLFGDFFGSGELSELEQAMEGLALDKGLAAKLELLHVERYIHGIGAAQLAELLCG